MSNSVPVILPLSVSDIKRDAILVKGNSRVKVVGVRGRTTVLVRPAEGWPYSNRSRPVGIRLDTLLRDYHVEVPKQPPTPSAPISGERARRVM